MGLASVQGRLAPLQNESVSKLEYVQERNFSGWFYSKRRSVPTQSFPPSNIKGPLIQEILLDQMFKQLFVSE